MTTQRQAGVRLSLLRIFDELLLLELEVRGVKPGLKRDRIQHELAEAILRTVTDADGSEMVIGAIAWALQGSLEALPRRVKHRQPMRSSGGKFSSVDSSTPSALEFASYYFRPDGQRREPVTRKALSENSLSVPCAKSKRSVSGPDSPIPKKPRSKHSPRARGERTKNPFRRRRLTGSFTHVAHDRFSSHISRSRR